MKKIILTNVEKNRRANEKQIAFLFSGQGTQTERMMKDLYEKSSNVREVFDIADRTLSRSITDLCFYGSQEEIDVSHNSQPCMLVAELAAYVMMKERMIEPNAVAGFSLGEYAALVAAGVIEIEDAIRIVQYRADAMQDAVPIGEGSMAAIMKATKEEVLSICNSIEGYVEPANYNSLMQTVVSGETAAVEQVVKIAKEKKYRAAKLNVSIPSHCRMMEPARKKMEDYLNQFSFRNAQIPLYLNYDGNIHYEGEDIKQKLLLQLISPIQWISTINNMKRDGVDIFIELGVGDTLAKLVNRIDSNLKSYYVEDIDTLDNTISELENM